MTYHHILMIASCVCFGLSTLNVPVPINLVALGLLCWALTTVL